MTDCFLCCCAEDSVRLGFATAVYAVLSETPGIELTTLRTVNGWLDPRNTPSVPVCLDKRRFQRERRKRAEFIAASDPYIVCDDDCLPLQKDWVAKGLKIMEQHPDFGLIGLRERAILYLPEAGHRDDEVEERTEAGGIYFIRKNLLTNWPALTPHNEYDRLQADAIRKAGFKVGMFNQLTMNHIGLGYSTATWNESGHVAN